MTGRTSHKARNCGQIWLICWEPGNRFWWGSSPARWVLISGTSHLKNGQRTIIYFMISSILHLLWNKLLLCLCFLYCKSIKSSFLASSWRLSQDTAHSRWITMRFQMHWYDMVFQSHCELPCRTLSNSIIEQLYIDSMGGFYTAVTSLHI